MNDSVPIVAIVGRANVGKSSLFNALLGRREAIVAREAGTTRDSVSAKVSHDSKDWWLVDTAGLKPAEDDFELSIQDQLAEAAQAAQVIVVVTDAEVPPTAEDRRVATMALKSRHTVLLAVNKLDKVKDSGLDKWKTLGIKDIYGLSATQGRGVDELRQTLANRLPTVRIGEKSASIRLALLGRPNVGKSSLFNSLAAKQQALVSAKAGTTRDVNRLNIRYHDHDIEIMDTAGIRRSGKIEAGVERFSVLRSLAAIEESDICAVLMDTQELSVQLDQKIASMVQEAGKGLILVVTKWDTTTEEHAEATAKIKADFAFVPWAPLVFTSAITGENVTQLFKLALEINSSRQTRFATSELNNWLQQAISIHPPAGLKGHAPKLKYMVQEEDQPLPSFKIFGSRVKTLHWSYRRYLERSFREKWPLAGTPLRFWFIEQSG